MLEKGFNLSYLGNIFTRTVSITEEEDPKFISYVGRKLADLSPFSHDMNVLDLTSGRGATFYPLLEGLSHQGCLIGIDTAEELVDQLNMELIAYKIQNAVAIAMDLDKLEFHDEFFDLITCNLGIFLFENITQVFKELKRIMKDNGYFTFSTWKALHIDQFSWYNNVLQKYISKEDLEPLEESKKKQFFTVEGIESLLKKEDFKIVKIASEQKTFTYTNDHNFWNKLWSGPERAIIEKIPESKIDQFKSDLFEAFNSVKGNSGFDFQMGIIYVCCKK